MTVTGKGPEGWRQFVREELQPLIAAELERDNGVQPYMDQFSSYHERMIRDRYDKEYIASLNMAGALRSRLSKYQTLDEDTALASALKQSEITAKREEEMRRQPLRKHKSLLHRKKREPLDLEKLLNNRLKQEQELAEKRQQEMQQQLAEDQATTRATPRATLPPQASIRRSALASEGQRIDLQRILQDAGLSACQPTQKQGEAQASNTANGQRFGDNLDHYRARLARLLQVDSSPRVDTETSSRASSPIPSLPALIRVQPREKIQFLRYENDDDETRSELGHAEMSEMPRFNHPGADTWLGKYTVQDPPAVLYRATVEDADEVEEYYYF
ncbi:hypothetical protein B0T25DRAFT_583215 [Lasiosphaeria hispida]|uniref:Uncharacterized protein n=1 Tax=Lasiosphaeria hispida TaxID=260671 RepID=A0AAJ0HB19_9PEZI|nr:hypothetical protein B0T25DRAFT_583215 [Lasiosphaeria hispida]